MGTRHNTIQAMVADSETRLRAIENDSGRSAGEKAIAVDTERKAMGRAVARYKARQSRDALSVALPVIVSLGRNREARVVAAETLPGDDALRMTVRVFNGRDEVTPPGLNPWIVVNPPMLMADPAGDVTLLGGRDVDGNPLPDRTFREDPAAVIADLIARKLGG